jgi:hypothetical protein
MGRQSKVDLLAKLGEFGPIDTGRHNENTPWKVLNEEVKRAKKRQEIQEQRLAAQDRDEAQRRLLQQQRELEDVFDDATERGDSFSEEDQDADLADPMDTTTLPPAIAAPNATLPQRGVQEEYTKEECEWSRLSQYMYAPPPTREEYNREPLKKGDIFATRAEAEVKAAAAHVNMGTLTMYTHTGADHLSRRCPCQVSLPKCQQQACAVITFSKLKNGSWQCIKMCKRICEGEPDKRHVETYGGMNYTQHMVLPLQCSYTFS